jgi:hypothetical protein
MWSWARGVSSLGAARLDWLLAVEILLGNNIIFGYFGY